MRKASGFVLFISLIFLSTNIFSQYFCAEIIEPKFDELSHFVKGYATAKMDGKWGFIDISGEFVCPPIYDKLEIYEFDGFPATVILNNKKGSIDKSGNFIVKPEYEELYITKYGIYNAKLNNKWFYIGKDGERLNENQYDSISFGLLWGYTGYDVVYKQSKCGLVDSLGNTATYVIYEEIYEVFGDIFAKKDNKFGVLGNNDSWLIKPEYNFIYEFYNGLAVADQNDKWGLLKKDGTWQINNDYYQMIYEGANFILVTSNDYKTGIMDTLGNWILQPEYDYIWNYTNSKLIAKKDDISGIINLKGEWLCEFTYPYAWHYSHDLFEYDNDGNYGLMDNTGNVLRDYEFDEIGYMWEGYAYFIENGKYGIIDSLGEIIYEAIDDEEPFYYSKSKLFTVKSGDYSGVINNYGIFVIEPDKEYVMINENNSYILSKKMTTDYWNEQKPYYTLTAFNGELIYEDESYINDYYRGFIFKYDDLGNNIVMHENNYVRLLFQYKYENINNLWDSIAVVTKDGKYGAIMISDAQTIAKLYVENRINEWQKKGEYEKLSDYQIRVTKETRQEKAKLLYDEIKSELISQYVDFSDWYDFTLSTYDAENESYLVTFKNLNPIVLHIPVNEAKQFKDNKHTCFGNNPVLEFDGKNFYLLGIEFTNYETETAYKYDATNSPNYTYSSMKYNFKPLEFNYNTNVQSFQKPVLSNDLVDTDIPIVNTKAENTFAVVIGNEKYKNEQQVIYAENDALVFKEYLVKTLGMPENHIHLLLNATLGEILGEIEWLKKTAKAFEGEAKLVFYYAGHGMPEAETNEAYILPVDGSSSNSRTGIKLSLLYNELAEYPTLSTVIILDACFSGASRDGMLASGRGTRIVPKDNMVTGNMIVLSAASGSQIANPYEEKSHGLFTYYLLSQLRKTKGDLSYGDLIDYLKTNVKRTAIEKNKEQEPVVIYSNDIKDQWMNMKVLK
ncbi:MAG TPA: WG repeat-containing protein [Bacteroidales bacterium]|nr:WG repeat-containing protein [Bacteroidales bacterium]